MAEAYAKLIMAGKKTINDAPEKIRAAVQAVLDAAGWKPNEEG